VVAAHQRWPAIAEGFNETAVVATRALANRVATRVQVVAATTLKAFFVRSLVDQNAKQAWSFRIGTCLKFARTSCDSRFRDARGTSAASCSCELLERIASQPDGRTVTVRWLA